MNRPELVPENYEAIYEYFLNFEPNERIQNMGFWVMNATHGPEIHYLGDADSTVADHLEAGKSLILPPNHQSNADTPVLASLVCFEPFQLLRNNTTIPAKAEMFDWPLLGKFFPHMLAHPTFRGKDFAKDEEGQALRELVTAALIQFNIDYIDNGGNVALFPESTRNMEQPGIVQALRQGIARIALGVARPEDLLIVPIGIHYRNNRLKLKPVVVINEPFSPAGMTQDALLERTRNDIQEARDKAEEFAFAA